MSSPAPAAWTIKTLLAWTTDFLAKKKLDAPRLEAQILLAHVMGCPRIELIARSDDLPTDDEKARFRDLVKRRVDGTPVAHLVGKREFYSLPFEVSPAVLIPRPDTEALVMAALDRLKGRADPAVLDLGTGSGCVAVTLAKLGKPPPRVTAVDLSAAALAVARRNAAANGVGDRVTFLEGDLFAPVPADSRFDLVVSNPPYITHAELAGLDPGVRDHEPRLALDGGPDGLLFYRRIAADAGRFLRPGGWLLVEVGHTQAAPVRELFAGRAEFADGPMLKDGGGRQRVVTARRR